MKFSKPRWVPVNIDKVAAATRKQGVSDGRLGLPARHELVSHRIEALKQQAESTLSAIGQDWADMHRILHGEWSRLTHILRERERELPPLEEEVRKLEAAVKRREKTCDERRAQIEVVTSVERHRLGSIAYFFGLTAVFLIDVPLNSVVFNIFGDSPLFTYLLASLLGILIVPAAHVLGVQLRNRLTDKVITTLATLIPLGLMVAVAAMRKDYLQETNSLVKGLTGWRGVTIFVAFNLAIFASGVFLSYLRHDPFGQALEDAEKALRKARRDRDTASRLLEFHDRQVAAIRGRLAELRAWGEEEFTKAKHNAHTQRNFYERLMHEYAGANKTGRAHPDEPVRILDDPDLWDIPTMPPDLTAETLSLWRPTDELGLPQALPALA